MIYAAIAAAIAAIIGAAVAAGNEAEARALRTRAASMYGDEILPHLDDAIAEQIGETAFSRIKGTDDTRREQLGIDAELADIYDTEGMTSADDAAYDVARREVSNRASSNAANAQLSAARRGQSGGQLGAILASASGQQELDALASMNADIATAARGRALQALSERSDNAASMRGQDFEEQSTLAQALDNMNQFNAGQRASTQRYNNDIKQSRFANALQLRQSRANALNGVAGSYDASADAARATAAGVGNAALSYGAAADAGWGTEPKKKKAG